MKNQIRNVIVWILTQEARVILWRHRPKIICVTGSVGKTTTKDMLAIVLSTKYKVLSNAKSYNSEFGVPLTILGLKSAWQSPLGWLTNILVGLFKVLYYMLPVTYYELLVLELGADHPGDIRKSCLWLGPYAGIVTSMGGDIPAHSMFFNSPDDVASEKKELLRALPKEGIAVLNLDDKRVWNMRDATKAHVYSYGRSSEAVVRVEEYRVHRDASARPTGIAFRIEHKGSSLPIRINGVLGEGIMWSALAAYTLAEILGVKQFDIGESLSKFVPPPGRMRLLTGLDACTIIDDTYNSSPGAAVNAIDALVASTDKASARVAILGDMLELGKHEEAEHKKIGTYLADKIDHLVCVGERAHWIGEALQEIDGDSTRISYFSSSEQCVEALDRPNQNIYKPGATILVKGSQGIRMERITKSLLANQSASASLLVRQDENWLK